MVETIYFSGLLGDRRVGFYAGYQVPIRAQIMGGSAWDAETPALASLLEKNVLL